MKKIVNGGYIIAYSPDVGVEMADIEFENLLNVIRNRPTAESGYDYRLKTDLTWELYELPVEASTAYTEEQFEELTYDELLEALAEAEYELCLWELGIHDDFMEE